MRLLLPTWLMLACGQPPPPEAPPAEAVHEVVGALEEAVAQAGEGSPAALEAWARAHQRFEEDLEPALRSRFQPGVVTSIEYRFGWIRARLAAGADPSEEVHRLSARLKALLPAIHQREPRPVVPSEPAPPVPSESH